AARTGTVPAIGGPSTGLLIGGRPLDASPLSGGRITWGWAVNEEETAGLEITYFFTGTRTATAAAGGGGPGGPNRTLGRPVVNPTIGREDAVIVAEPGGLVGAVTAYNSVRMTGWELTGVANLFAAPGVRLNAIGGYRYFLMNEGLRVEQTGWDLAGGRGLAAADQFDTHNNFHGGQLGLLADITRGAVFLELAGKVGFGQTVQVVEVSGQSVAVRPGFPTPAVQTYSGGVLGQSTNGGRFSRSAFAVLPEGSLKLGYRFHDRSRLYFGYNFLYLSDVVRPGDQVDRAVDPAAVPAFGRGAPASAGYGDRPQPLLTATDFWVQGLLFGLEFRY
ncbi:MAG: BBP7 family outer membrane beta-barrel protein, partial [Fimbriiglobus sp.]